MTHMDTTVEYILDELITTKSVMVICTIHPNWNQHVHSYWHCT